jgi:hypothetical protein
VQASRPVEHVQALVPYHSIDLTEPDVVTLSSSDTEEALDFLSIGLVRGLSSRLSEGDTREPSLSSSSDLFEDWPKANDMAASVYVALTVKGSSSRASPTETPHDR